MCVAIYTPSKAQLLLLPGSNCNVELFAPLSVCSGDDVTLTATNLFPATYNWSLPAGTIVINSSSPYQRVVRFPSNLSSATVSVTVGGSCQPKTVSKVIKITNGLPRSARPIISGNDRMCDFIFYYYEYGVFGITNATSYEWELTGPIVGNQSNSKQFFTSTNRAFIDVSFGPGQAVGINYPATIRVRGKNACGATNWVTKNITVSCVGDVEPIEPSNPYSFELEFVGPGRISPSIAIQPSPNPVAIGQQVNLTSEATQTFSQNNLQTLHSTGLIKVITVHNAMGQQVLQLKPEQWANEQIGFSTQGFRAGVHFIKVHTTNGTLTRRFIVVE